MAARPVVVQLATTLAARADVVWAEASTMAGVNAELGPWVRMTHPPEATSLAEAAASAAPLAFDSWVLVLGIVPLDRHHLRLERVVDPAGPDGPFGFDEESTSWLQQRWRHERRISPLGEGCTVADRLTIVPRLRVARPLVARVVPAVFRHRHRRLRARFGSR